MNPPIEPDDVLVGDRLAIDLDALIEAHQVRRGVEPDAIAGAPQDVGEARSHRALAVRAGDVDGFVATVGVAEAGKNPADGGKPQFDPKTPEAKEGLEAGNAVFGLRHRHEKTRWGRSHRVWFNGFQRLASACGPGRGNAFSSLRFALLASPKFARLFVAFLQLQALEKAVILDLLFQNAHCFFDVIVNDPDFDFLQLYRPFRAVGNVAMMSSPADSLQM